MKRKILIFFMKNQVLVEISWPRFITDDVYQQNPSNSYYSQQQDLPPKFDLEATLRSQNDISMSQQNTMPNTMQNTPLNNPPQNAYEINNTPMNYRKLWYLKTSFIWDDNFVILDKILKMNDFPDAYFNVPTFAQKFVVKLLNSLNKFLDLLFFLKNYAIIFTFFHKIHNFFPHARQSQQQMYNNYNEQQNALVQNSTHYDNY